MYDLLAVLASRQQVVNDVDQNRTSPVVLFHSNPRRPLKVLRTSALITGAVLVTVLAAACSTGSSTGSSSPYGFKEVKQVKNSTITVWVDATRLPAAKAFEKANPSVKVKIVTYDGAANGSNSFKTKMQLFDRAKKGWPDVVWSTQDNDSAWASQASAGEQPFAAQLNSGLVPSATLAGFAKGSLDPCTVSGKVYCLRNDLAQNVLWYNKTLMDQFGYTIPTTWEQYEALGAKVAKDHPGYIVGAAGDAWTPEIYMWASKCQANDVTGIRSVTVDTTSADCTRMAKLLDAGIANKSLTTDSVFSPSFLTSYTGKVLMMPGPAWYSGAIFDSKTSLNVPAGQIGAAAPLAWKGETAVTGDVGGGTWFVSSHSANLAAAEKFATFVTTADDYQVDLAPGLPAYSAAATKWVAKQVASNYFVDDLSNVTKSASQIWSGWGSPTFSQEAIWAKTITPGVTSGQTIESLLPAWGTAIKNQAQVDGYTVK
jgi:ABC-type glycerol-3-phosphate transport system substrate-binding protein